MLRPTLEILVSKHSNPGSELKIADPTSPKDQEEVLAFFSKNKMNGKGLQVRTERHPNFFSLLQARSSEHFTILHKNSRCEIDAMMTLAVRNAFIKNRSHKVIFIGDFRADRDKSVLKLWRDFYPELLSVTHDYFKFTAIIDSNTEAANALVHQTKYAFKYQKIAQYQMVNVAYKFSRKPPHQSDSPFSLRPATLKDTPSLIKFLSVQSRLRPLGYDFYGGELERRLACWPGFGLSHFLLLMQSDQILGCVAPWDPHLIKRHIISDLPWYYKPILPLIGGPKLGQPLETTYLTHLEIDHSLSKIDRLQAFRILFNGTYELGKKSDSKVISFCDFAQDCFQEALGFRVSYSIPMSLYAVSSTREPAETDFDLSAHQSSPGFEIALI